MAGKPAGGTPATDALTAAGISFTLHSYTHHDDSRDFGAKAARELGVDELRIFRHPIILGGGTPLLPPVTTAIALDLLEMAPIRGVHFIQGDFREDAVLTQLEEALGEREVGVVLSDMAPNMSGVAVMDQARVMHLAELGLDFSRAHLKPEGAFLVKVFQGRDYEAFVRAMREAFQNVVVR